MLTGRHNNNGDGYATATPLGAAQATGPPLQPQGSLTRSLTRRPPAALDPGDLYGPWQTHTAGRPNACPTGARRGTPTNCKITITESLRFQGIASTLVVHSYLIAACGATITLGA
jgi:hypothetical protein